jgi:simple sugar transport system ATP-binding protein
VCQSIDSPLYSLSGGNIQKVVVAREAHADPDFLIAEQPTRGVDIGSANAIHKILIGLRNSGKAILLFSADLGEALAMSDRLMVMYSGEIAAVFDNPAALSEQELGLYMLGIKRQ